MKIFNTDLFIFTISLFPLILMFSYYNMPGGMKEKGGTEMEGKRDEGKEGGKQFTFSSQIF